MIVPAITLKKIVKKLNTVASVNTHLTPNTAEVTDGDMGITVQCKLVDAPVTVNSKLFSGVVGKMSKDVTLTVEPGKLLIQSAKFKASLPTIVADSPIFPLAEEDCVSIDSKALIDLLGFAASVTDEKVTFDHTGAVQIEGTGHAVYSVGTDNLRIAQASLTEPTTPFNLLIPSKAIRSIRELEGNILIARNPSTLFFTDTESVVYFRKLTKKFPDVNKVLPKLYKLDAEIKIDSFLEALDRLSTTLNPEQSNNLIVLEFDNESVKITTDSAEDTVEVSNDPFSESFSLRVGANLKHLINFLTSVRNHGTIIFNGNDTGKPFLLKAGNKKLLMAGIRI